LPRISQTGRLIMQITIYILPRIGRHYRWVRAVATGVVVVTRQSFGSIRPISAIIPAVGRLEGSRCTRLDAEGGNLRSIIAAFRTSQEYTNRFSGLSDSELINNLYRNMFDRDAEPGASGMGFYLDLLESRRQEWRDTHNGSNQGATEYALSRIALDVLTGAQGRMRSHWMVRSVPARSIEAVHEYPISPYFLLSEPPKRVTARHSAQGIHSLAKRCNTALARLGGSLRVRRETAAICGVARA